jgi:hypothetical protein
LVSGPARWNIRGTESHFAARLADEPGIDAVDARLVHRIEDRIQILGEFGRGDGSDMVVDAITSRHIDCAGHFVVCGSGELAIRERAGADALLTAIAHQSDQCARIDSAGQKGANLDIGDKMMAHAVAHRRADVAIADESPACAGQRGRNIGVARRRARSVLAAGQPVSCRQCLDCTIGGERFGHRPGKMETRQARRGRIA